MPRQMMMTPAARRIISRANRQHRGFTADASGLPVEVDPPTGNSLAEVLQRIEALEDLFQVFVTAEPDDDEGTDDEMAGAVGSEVQGNTVVSTDEAEVLAQMNAANAKAYRQGETTTAGSQSTAAPGTGRESEGAAFMPNSAGSIDVPSRTSKTARTMQFGTTFGATQDRGSLRLNRGQDHAAARLTDLASRDLTRTSDLLARINRRNAQFR